MPASCKCRRAFTLIELLTVVVIIGILAAIIIPTTAAAHAAANKAKTRAQFAQWSAAIEAFRQEYGCYPAFETGGAGAHKVNGNTAAGPNLSASHQFHDTLVGAHRDGSALPAATVADPASPQAQNIRRIQFVAFTDFDLAPANAVDPSIRGLVRDAFGGVDIAIVVDQNLDGRIMYGGTNGDVAELSFVSPPDDPTRRLRPAAGDFPAGSTATSGVRTGVIFYCAPPGAESAADLILSWK